MIRTPPTRFTRPIRPHPAASATTHLDGDAGAMLEKTKELKLQTLSSEESADAVEDVTEISTQQPPWAKSSDADNAPTVNFDALEKNNDLFPCSYVTASTDDSSFNSSEVDFTKGIDDSHVEQDYHDMERDLHKIKSATTYIAGKVTETKATADQIRETQLEEKEQSSTRHDELTKKQDEANEMTQQLRGEQAWTARKLLEGQDELSEQLEAIFIQGQESAARLANLEGIEENKEKRRFATKAKSAVDRMRGNGGN